jgi:hypothetical protein
MPGWRIRQMAATCLKDSHLYARVVARISEREVVASLSNKAVVREWR